MIFWQSSCGTPELRPIQPARPSACKHQIFTHLPGKLFLQVAQCNATPNLFVLGHFICSAPKSGQRQPLPSPPSGFAAPRTTDYGVTSPFTKQDGPGEWQCEGWLLSDRQLPWWLLERTIPPGTDIILRHWDSAEGTCPFEERFLPFKATVILRNSFLLSWNLLAVDYRSCCQRLPWLATLPFVHQGTSDAPTEQSPPRKQGQDFRLSSDSNSVRLRQGILTPWLQITLPLFIRPALGGSTGKQLKSGVRLQDGKGFPWIKLMGFKPRGLWPIFLFDKLEKWITQGTLLLLKIVPCR